jgi:hypothetical protein
MSRGPLIERSQLRPRNTLSGEELSWIVRNVANSDDIPVMYPIPALREQAGVRTPHAGFQPTDRPADAGPPVHYVIITDSTSIDGVKVGNLIAEFQRLADWKTKKGMPAVVRTVKWIHENYDGDDLQEEIRNFIIDAYKLWGTDWVLLGGDVEIVPDRWFGDNSVVNDLLATVYYGGLDGTWNHDGDEYYNWYFQADPFWDVWVGRLPVDLECSPNIGPRIMAGFSISRRVLDAKESIHGGADRGDRSGVGARRCHLGPGREAAWDNPDHAIAMATEVRWLRAKPGRPAQSLGA